MRSLLLFAHYKEAKAFLKEFSFKKKELSFYESENFDLVLLGEGIFQVFPILSKILAEKNYSFLYNFGTAGRTHTKIALDEVFTIKTSYLFSSEAHYESFSLEGEKDCLTLFHRNDPPLGLAHLVDRELWAISKLAKLYQKPLKSFKYVSDCLVTQKEVFSLHYFSEKLLESFLKEKIQEDNFSISLPSSFYFTESQKRMYFKYYQYFQSRNKLNLLEEYLLENYPSNKKEATKLLLKKMENFLFPLHEKIYEEKNQQLKMINCPEVQFKTNLEDIYFHGKITSRQDLNKIHFKFKELEQCFNEFF